MSTLLLLLIGAVALGGACAHSPDPASDLAAARALFGRNLGAIQAKDRDAYLACYRQDERLLRNGPGGPVRGFDGLAASTSTVPASWPDSLEAADVELEWLGPGHVYGSYRYRVVYSGAAFEGISERVFVKRGDRWEIVVSTAFGQPASSDDRLSAVTFLVGDWVTTQGERTTEESWSHARSGTMFGSARTLVGDRTVSFEHLRIELDEDGLRLVALPVAQKETHFRLSESAEDLAVFENRAHDFPRRIVYRREGTRLHAQIEGAGKVVTWVYERR